MNQTSDVAVKQLRSQTNAMLLISTGKVILTIYIAFLKILQLLRR
jgi:hypothetical protein